MDDDQQHQRLGEAIRGLSRRRVLVPSEIDARVRLAARPRLKVPGSRKERVRRKITPFHKWMPLAASVLIGAMILSSAWLRNSQYSFDTIADLNRDGQLDIRDALLVAQRIDSGAEAPDLNSDGFLDLRDAEEIAFHAVALATEPVP